MKKINKLFLSIALTLMLGLSLCMFACDMTNDKLVSVELIGSMKTEYYIGENIDFQNAKVKLVYENRELEVTPDESKVTGFDTTTTGSRKLTITYYGVSRTVDYVVRQGITYGKFYGVYNGLYSDYTVGGEVYGNHNYCYELLAGGVANYYLNDYITDGQFSWQYSSGTVSMGDSVINYDIIFSFTYNGTTQNYYVSILSSKKIGIRSGSEGQFYMVLAHKSLDDVLSIELVGSMKTEYRTGESIDFQSAKVKLVYENREVEVTPDASKVTGFDTTTAGSRKLTITYYGATKLVDYTVEQGLVAGKYYTVYSGAYSGYNGSTSETYDGKTTNYTVFNADGTCEMWSQGELYESGTWIYQQGTHHYNGLDFEYDIVGTMGGVTFEIKLFNNGTRLGSIVSYLEEVLYYSVIGHESNLPAATEPVNPFASA